MPIGHSERLVRRTRRRLFAVTLGLLALLVVGVGSATAIMGLAALDADVDHALLAAVAAQAATVTPETLGGDGGEATNGDDGAQAPELDDRPPAAADTFMLVLDGVGQGTSRTRPAGRSPACRMRRSSQRRGPPARTCGRSRQGATASGCSPFR